MMPRLRRITPSRIKAAVKAAEDAGLRVGRVEIDRDGKIILIAAVDAQKQVQSPLEEWESRRGAR